MGGRKLKLIVFSLIAVLLIFTSAVYRAKFYTSYTPVKGSLPQKLKNKTIVRLCMKKSVISPTMSYLIDEFNSKNKDNIYIQYTEYKEDYYNAVKTQLAAGDETVDIFEYGYTDLLKNGQIASLNDMNFDSSLMNSSNIVSYKNMPIGIKLADSDVKIIWNKELFKEAGLNPDKPPRTWNEVIDDCVKIKNKFPDITPFAFPITQYEDIKVSIGEPSVNSDSIYTSFWNYKSGKYDFSYASDILSVYNKMYKLGLIPKNFDEQSRNKMRSEFYQGNIAMMVSTYEDKGYFSNIIPLRFPMGIQDVIQVNQSNPNVYYYTNNSDFLVINKDSIKDKKKKNAVKEVYEYMLSNNINQEILNTRDVLPLNIKSTQIKNDIYSGYNDTSKFQNEVYDPTLFLSRDSAYEIGLITDAIKGKSTVKSSIEKLNEKYKSYYDFAVDKEKFDFSYYVK